MAGVSDDRWTCPFCHRTEITAATTERGRQRAIRGFQHTHANRHGTVLAAAASTSSPIGAQP